MDRGATPGQIPNIDTYIRYRRIDENKNYPDMPYGNN